MVTVGTDTQAQVAVRNDSDADFVLARHTLGGSVEPFDERDAYRVDAHAEPALAHFDEADALTTDSVRSRQIALTKDG